MSTTHTPAHAPAPSDTIARDEHPIPLFEPLTLCDITLRNRIVVSPMCQYSSKDGFATDWHLVHLGSRAVGGAALVMAEATAVEARGRISPHDLGLYLDDHVEALARITTFIKERGSIPGIQLAHAGRKGSTLRPWSGQGAVPVEAGGWEPVGPGPEPFAPSYPLPRPLTCPDIAEIVAAFQVAAQRALAAGFQVIEIHAAHGYLLHEFLSPLSNHRDDAYGGTLANRMRFLLEVVNAIRKVWPSTLPLFVRLSASDWREGGLDIEETVRIASELRRHEVDLVDASSGGNVASAPIPLAPGYQVPFAERIRAEARIATGAVGFITDPGQANEIISRHQADLIFLARELLRDPYWPMHAARALGADVTWPSQYLRAR